MMLSRNCSWPTTLRANASDIFWMTAAVFLSSVAVSDPGGSSGATRETGASGSVPGSGVPVGGGGTGTSVTHSPYGARLDRHDLRHTGFPRRHLGGEALGLLDQGLDDLRLRARS